MAVRLKRIGTGSTQFDQPVLGADISADDLHHTLNYAAEGHSFEGIIKPIEDYCRNLLTDNGCNPDGPTCTADDANKQTEIYYCYLILRYLGIVRDRVSKVDAATVALASQAIKFAFKLGCSVREMELKGFADSGWKCYQSGHRGGRPTQAERNRLMADEFQTFREKSKLNDTALKVQIGKQHRLRFMSYLPSSRSGLQPLSLFSVLAHTGLKRRIVGTCSEAD